MSAVAPAGATQSLKQPMPSGSASGAILPGAIYRLDAFLATVGWGRAAMRRARRQGLRVVRDGRSVFVLGDEFLRYLRQIMDRPAPSSGVRMGTEQLGCGKQGAQ